MKKIILVSLIIISLFMVVGCGKKGEENNNSNSKNGSTGNNMVFDGFDLSLTESTASPVTREAYSI